MRDPADTRTSEIEAFPLPKTPGRKRVHASAADRQRAYRERKRAVQVQSVLQGQPETVTKNVTATSRAELLAQLQVIADRDNEIARLRAQVQALQADNAELMQRLDRAWLAVRGFLNRQITWGEAVALVDQLQAHSSEEQGVRLAALCFLRSFKTG
jgi:hypothetical protein